MKINLRKASAILSLINEKINSNESHLRGVLVLTEFDDVEKCIDNTTNLTHKKFNANLDLIKVMYEIRKSVAKANMNSGISDVLTDIALEQKYMELSATVATSGVIPDRNVIKGKLAKLAKQESGYGYESALTLSIFTQEDIDNAGADVALRRIKINELKDSLLEFNVTTKISLTDEQVAILSDNGII